MTLLPARIIGYISTQFGVAIEYQPAAHTEIKVIKGSGRIEDLLVDAPAQARKIGPLFKIEGHDCSMAKLTLSGGFPFRLATIRASVSFQGVMFQIGSWKRDIHFAEVYGFREASNWSPGKAESRAKDEVLAALVEISLSQKRNVTISDYIAQFKDKKVLVLGAYDDEGSRRLQEISKSLASQGYDPILIKDIPDHPYQNLQQKVVAIGTVSRFVIVDDSSSSGHISEIDLCKQNDWVTVLLRVGGVGSSWMTAGVSHTSNVILELPYDAIPLNQAVVKAAKWAEEKLQELKRKFDNTYPWRTNSS